MDTKRLKDGIDRYSAAQTSIERIQGLLGVVWNDHNHLAHQLRLAELEAERALAMVRAAGQRAGGTPGGTPASYYYQYLSPETKTLCAFFVAGVTTDRSQPLSLLEGLGLEGLVPIATLSSLGLVVVAEGQVRLSDDGWELVRKRQKVKT